MLIYIFVLLLLLFGLWGNLSLLQFCYILFSGYTIVYTLYTYKYVRNVPLSNTPKKYIVLFLYISLAYFIVSYINLPQFWNIKILDFDKGFIIRHFFVVYSLFISISIAISICNKNILLSISNKILYILLCICIIGVKVGDYSHILVAFGIQTLTLIILRTKNKILLILVPMFFWGNNSTYAISACWIIICTLFSKQFINFFKKHIVFKIILLVIIFVSICLIFSSFIYTKIEGDTNALWRLMVWSDEIRTFIKTHGMGVGFGSAYVSNEIFYYIENSHMYDGDGAMFLVANHNSILNIFYRLGIIGGGVFCMIIISTLTWFSRIYNNVITSREACKYLIWALINWLYNLIVICLNPGLESPRFATSYLFSLGCIWGLLLYYQKEIQLKYRKIPNSSKTNETINYSRCKEWD